MYIRTLCVLLLFFFFNDTAPTEIYTLSLHDALPISGSGQHRPHLRRPLDGGGAPGGHRVSQDVVNRDRKSTRLNSSHITISYAVFCLKKKKKKNTHDQLVQVHKNCLVS